MKVSQGIARTIMFLAPIASNAEEYVCEHKDGAYSYGGSKIYVTKAGASVTVNRVDEGGVLKEDSWSYRVVAEDSMFGFRAIRFGRDSSIPSDEIVDIAIGGEIILLEKDNSISLFTVGVNAANKKHDSELFTCTSNT